MRSLKSINIQKDYNLLKSLSQSKQSVIIKFKRRQRGIKRGV